MPCFLVHQHVEDLEHALRQEFRLARGLEGAEAEKAVHAFTKSEIDERGLQVRREGLQRLLGRVETVAIDHDAEQLRMPRFLHALQRDGLTHQRILNHWRECRDDRSGATFGVVHLLPERHRAKPVKLCVVQVRPWQHRRIVQLVRLQELPAEQLLVGVGTNLDRH